LTITCLLGIAATYPLPAIAQDAASPKPPISASVNAAVLTALPFGRRRRFRAVAGTCLPDWTRDFAGSWAQIDQREFLRCAGSIATLGAGG
jgi:hypothetical protein